MRHQDPLRPRAAPSSEHTGAMDRCHQEPSRLLLDLLLPPISPVLSRVPCRRPCDLASSASLEEDDLNIKSPMLSRASASTSASPSPADDRGRTLSSKPITALRLVRLAGFLAKSRISLCFALPPRLRSVSW